MYRVPMATADEAPSLGCFVFQRAGVWTSECIRPAAEGDTVFGNVSVTDCNHRCREVLGATTVDDASPGP